ncbi:hypothetical protein T5B8_14625 [Salinisphaera sp. T5B8]|uniref:YceD family protein n=1 Tax=Salinisphaera sp. T5B8 TaxID=1304154 RepID=UPI00333E91B7
MNTPRALVSRVDYRRLATQQGRIEGCLDLVRLDRVAAETIDAGSEPVVVDLVFREDAQRRVHVEGDISTTLRLECQRCLNAFDQPMNVDVAGVVVGDDSAAANVPREYEPVLADGDMLDVHALVADELLLALPSVARCSRPECTAQYVDHDMPRSDEQDDERRNNPFAVLSQLKRDD